MGVAYGERPEGESNQRDKKVFHEKDTQRGNLAGFSRVGRDVRGPRKVNPRGL